MSDEMRVNEFIIGDQRLKSRKKVRFVRMAADVLRDGCHHIGQYRGAGRL